MAPEASLPKPLSRRVTPGVVGLATCLFATCLFATEALAQVPVNVPTVHVSPVDAEAFIRQGADLRRQGRLDDALAALRRAYAAAPGPRPAALSGLLEQSLARWVDAEVHLAEGLSALDDPWIRRNRATLEPALADVRRHLGDLDVTGGEPGAEVVLDDAVRGTFPLSHALRVAAGTVTLEVRARGFLTVTRTVSVMAGERVSERVNMVRAAPVREEVTAAPVVTCARGLVLRDGLCYARPGAVADPRAGTLRWVGWAGLGVAVGASALAAGLWLDGNATLDGYVQDCGGRVAPAPCDARYTQTTGALSDRATVVNVLWGVAGVGAAAAVVGFVLSTVLGHGDGDTASGPRVAATPGGLGVVW